MKKHLNIGMLGGTFDPIHMAHLRIAEKAQQQFDFDTLYFIPCGIPPHRETPVASTEHRVAMIQSVIAKQPHFKIDRCEIDRNTPSYTIETLHILKARHPNDTLYLILGMDAFQALNQWKDWQQILTHCNLILVQRPGYEQSLHPELQDFLHRHQRAWPDKTPPSHQAIYTLLMDWLPISSSDIRQKLQSHKPVTHEIADEVLKYIKEHQLYV